ARTRSHRFAVLGLVPGAAYTVTATARGPFGLVSEPKSAAYAPGPMPDDFPAFEAAVSKPEKMAPGVTLFNLGRATGDPLADFGWSWLLMVDDAGRVVWYHRARPLVSDVRRLRNGDLAYLSFDPLTFESTLEEVTPLGETAALWTASQLGVDSMHHHIEELPNGNLVVLSNEMRAVGGYPEDLPDCPEGVCNVVGDRIVEFTRDGEVVRSWSLFDTLNPHRFVSPAFDRRLWDGLYGGAVTKDWTHTNAVVYDPSDDSFLLSCRNQDLVFKMSRETGALLWTFGVPVPGEDDGWPFLIPEYTDPGWPPSRQHSPKLLPGGRLLVYDNGNERKFTSVVEYKIDEAAKTVRFDWHWEDPDFDPKLYAPWVGDVDALPNGNLLVADGALLRAPGDASGRVWSKITELVQETGEKVFELRIRDDSPENPAGYELYRAERLSLYPPAESETPSP
ncbi:MAG: aryl-sulfate sulfotransferase, partial [Candidatus Methylomirabilis sp.]|nr:aryl-sulfate sulfotransferase [Deltaproteobacteria bacterium]